MIGAQRFFPDGQCTLVEVHYANLHLGNLEFDHPYLLDSRIVSVDSRPHTRQPRKRKNARRHK